MNNGINGPSKTRGNTVDLGKVSGLVVINYTPDSERQTVTLDGTATTFVEGGGWPSSSNTVKDLTLNIVVSNANTSVTWTIVTHWYRQPDSPLPVGTHVVLLRAVGNNVIEGHYIGNKTN